MFTHCDSCGPAVRASITAISGLLELSFCGHHARANKVGLEKAGFTLIELTPAGREREPEPA